MTALIASSMSLSPLHAQARPVAQIAVHSWSPSGGVSANATGSAAQVSGVTQLAVPIAHRFGATRRVSLDVATAAASSRVTLRRNGADETLALDGLSDLRLLVTATAFGDRVALLAGSTVPTGRTKLGVSELQALAAVASPAVQAPMPAYGGGASGSLGVTTVLPLGPFDVSAGAGYEQRRQFQPFASVEAGVPVSGTLTPGGVLTFSTRIDARIGNAALTIDGSMRQFLADTLAVARAQVTSASTYRLGPLTSLLAQLRPATRSARDLVFSVSAQHRAPYEVIGIGEIPRSDALLTALAAGGTVWRGNAGRLTAGVEARNYSGIRSDSSLVAAAFSDVSLSTSYARETGRGEFTVGGAVGAGTITPGGGMSTGTRRLTIRAGWRPL